MKKPKAFALIALLLCVSFALGACSASSSGTAVVQAVSMVADMGAVGLFSRYSGIVVTQNELKIQKDENMTIDEVLVKEGDEVEVDQMLFTYDMEASQLSFNKATLELEQLRNTITSKQSQLSSLYSEKKSAPSDEQLSYTIEIQSLEAEIREDQYNVTVKESDLKRLQESLAVTGVASTVKGRVQSISTSGTNENGESVPFMTIVETGTYRIKGTVNEMNVSDLYEGVPIIIRSRLDDTKTWTGSISMIDWENPTTGGNNMYGTSDESSSSSKYPFYVELDSVDGLMLGQHVYIEPDVGQLDVKTGLWMPGYYLNDTDTSAWIWAANSRDKLEKRKVTLGEYDADLDEYEILEGLTNEDFVAMPDDTLSEGMAVEQYSESDVSNDMDGSAVDGNAVDGGMVDEGTVDEGMVDEGAEDGAVAVPEG